MSSLQSGEDEEKYVIDDVKNAVVARGARKAGRMTLEVCAHAEETMNHKKNFKFNKILNLIMKKISQAEFEKIKEKYKIAIKDLKELATSRQGTEEFNEIKPAIEKVEKSYQKFCDEHKPQ